MTRSAISAADLLVNVTARTFSAFTPFSKRADIRQVTVLVLPVPAPARIRTGPFKAKTALRCALLSDSMEKPADIVFP